MIIEHDTYTWTEAYNCTRSSPRLLLSWRLDSMPLEFIYRRKESKVEGSLQLLIQTEIYHS